MTGCQTSNPAIGWSLGSNEFFFSGRELGFFTKIDEHNLEDFFFFWGNCNSILKYSASNSKAGDHVKILRCLLAGDAYTARKATRFFKGMNKAMRPTRSTWKNMQHESSKDWFHISEHDWQQQQQQQQQHHEQKNVLGKSWKACSLGVPSNPNIAKKPPNPNNLTPQRSMQDPRLPMPLYQGTSQIQTTRILSTNQRCIYVSTYEDQTFWGIVLGGGPSVLCRVCRVYCSIWYN